MYQKVKQALFALRNRYARNKAVYLALPVVFAALFVIYYLPVYAAFCVPDEALEQITGLLYSTVNPFLAAPMIVGLFFLTICVLYRSVRWKCVLSVFYAMSLIFSQVSMMGYSPMKQAVVYGVHGAIVVVSAWTTFTKEKTTQTTVDRSSFGG